MVADWLYTIRWKNLLIIWISIIVIILPFFHFSLLPFFTDFFLWAVVSMSVAAIGNITNDRLDLKQDQVNGRKNIFTEKKNKKPANWLVVGFLVLASVAIYLSGFTYFFLLLSISALALLLMYNLVFKKLPLVGNLLIALLTAFIFIGINHIGGQRVIYSQMGFNYLHIEALACMAFIATLNREIMKDAEDRKGDKRAGFKTLAVYLPDKILAVFSAIITCMGLTGTYFILAGRHFHPHTAFLIYGSWILLTGCLSAGFLYSTHPKKYVISTRILKGSMIGSLGIYLILQLIS